MKQTFLSTTKQLLLQLNNFCQSMKNVKWNINTGCKLSSRKIPNTSVPLNIRLLSTYTLSTPWEWHTFIEVSISMSSDLFIHLLANLVSRPWLSVYNHICQPHTSPMLHDIVLSLDAIPGNFYLPSPLGTKWTRQPLYIILEFHSSHN